MHRDAYADRPAPTGRKMLAVAALAAAAVAPCGASPTAAFQLPTGLTSARLQFAGSATSALAPSRRPAPRVALGQPLPFPTPFSDEHLQRKDCCGGLGRKGNRHKPWSKEMCVHLGFSHFRAPVLSPLSRSTPTPCCTRSIPPPPPSPQQRKHNLQHNHPHPRKPNPPGGLHAKAESRGPLDHLRGAVVAGAFLLGVLGGGGVPDVHAQGPPTPNGARPAVSVDVQVQVSTPPVRCTRHSPPHPYRRTRFIEEGVAEPFA